MGYVLGMSASLIRFGILGRPGNYAIFLNWGGGGYLVRKGIRTYRKAVSTANSMAREFVKLGYSEKDTLLLMIMQHMGLKAL